MSGALTALSGSLRNATGGGTPTVTSASISSDGETFTLNLSESCTTGAGGSAGMSITPSGGAAALGTATGSGSAVYQYPVLRTILTPETVTRTYVQPGNGIEATVGGIDLASFTTQAVTNNSAVIAVDDFTRANGPLGANWTNIITIGGVAIGVVGNQAAMTGNSGPNLDIEQYTAVTPTTNNRQTITLINALTAAQTIYFYARYDTGTDASYRLKITNAGVALQYDNGGGFVDLVTNSTTFTGGDTIGFDVRGTALACYKNGSSALSTTDSNLTTGTNVYFGVEITDNSTVTFDHYKLQN